MVVEIKNQVCDGHMFKWLMASGLAWLERNVEQVNRMNVFPVPDGDTGTNMLLTMQKAYGEIAHMDEAHVGIVGEALARGALMGARGNSGVILSQILSGFTSALRGHEFFDTELMAQACISAVESAYKAVIEPVEGTILTVARETKDAALEAAQQGVNLREALDFMIQAARESLKRTPQLLPILHEAGVLDSGGMGLVTILEGMQRMLNGEEVSFGDTLSKDDLNGHHWEEALVPEDEEGYGYDVQFLMHGENMDVAKIRADIDAMGWSTLVVGDERLIKVHVHVHNPGEPLSYAIGLGVQIDDVVVENMQLQYQGYVENRQKQESGVQKEVDGVAIITVVSGDGLFALFDKELHAARIIAGGQTMNPSTEDFLAAIDSLPNDEIIILPNNKNIIMAAEQAATLARGKKVHVIANRTIQQGIAAMLVYNDMRGVAPFEDIVEAMNEIIAEVVSVDITYATRNAQFDRVTVAEGQIIGLVDGKLVASGDELLAVVQQTLHKAHAEDYELVTLYRGNEVSAQQAQDLVAQLSSTFDNLEFEIVNGGQPLYPYIISIE